MPCSGCVGNRGIAVVRPQSNKAFIADGMGSTLGGLLGSSALTTYVESAAAVREGGRTGLTAVVCAAFFFLRCLLHTPDLCHSV